MALSTSCRGVWAGKGYISSFSACEFPRGIMEKRMLDQVNLCPDPAKFFLDACVNIVMFEPCPNRASNKEVSKTRTFQNQQREALAILPPGG